MSQSQNDHVYDVLVAVGEPAELGPLLAVACALARTHDGRVNLLSVTPDGKRPEWLNGSTWQRQTGKFCQGVPVTVTARLGRSAGGAILAATREHPPDLLLLGWRGEVGRGQYLLGSTLDPLMRKAPCDIAVVRIGEDLKALTDQFIGIERVLVPMAGGPNAALAADLALSLAQDVEVVALNVAQLSQGRAGVQLGRERLADALRPWVKDERVQPKVTQAPNVIGGILSEVRGNYDLLLIGATQESYLDRMLFGNVPQTVASSSPVPTIVAKRRVGQPDNLVLRAWHRLIAAVPQLTLAERVETYRAVRRGARPDADFFTMIGLSATIAALGLLLDSAAVIIGAMLVAPLMSAIVGMGLGVVQGDLRFLRLAAGATLRGMVLAIAIGALITIIVPNAAPNAEIMGRTNPSLLDLGIALASGVAGAYALCRKNVSASLSGVAIAAALVPPLAVTGIGITLGEGRIAGGALLLFFTNLVAISAAGGLVFWGLGFRAELGVRSRARVFKGGVFSVGLLFLAVTVPLGLLTVNSLRLAKVNRTVQDAIVEELGTLGGVDLVGWQITDDDGETLGLDVSVRAVHQISYQNVIELQKSIAVYLQRPVALRLTVIPVTQLDPFVPPTLTPAPTLTPTKLVDLTSTPTFVHTPSKTPTRTSTAVPTRAATATFIPSPTAIPTQVPAPTLTWTPAPVSAVISGTGGRGVNLRWTAGGSIAGVLREGELVQILSSRQTADNQEWVEVRDQQGRVGWVAAQYVRQQIQDE